ncbi:hypothetical protein OQA88_2135 [Cercophora sp. LCS_1]
MRPILLALPALAAASNNPHLPRQTSTPDADVSSCLAAIEAVGSTFPTIPRELVGLTDIEPITDLCNYTPPATMATAFSSFSTVLVSWVEENWPKVTSAAEECPSLSSDVDGFKRAWDLIICTDGIGGGATATSTGGDAVPTSIGGAETGSVVGSLSRTVATGTGTQTAGTQSTTAKGAAGARETGFVKGIIAAAVAICALMH